MLIIPGLQGLAKTCFFIVILHDTAIYCHNLPYTAMMCISRLQNAEFFFDHIATVPARDITLKELGTMHCKSIHRKHIKNTLIGLFWFLYARIYRTLIQGLLRSS